MLISYHIRQLRNKFQWTKSIDRVNRDIQTLYFSTGAKSRIILVSAVNVQEVITVKLILFPTKVALQSSLKLWPTLVRSWNVCSPSIASILIWTHSISHFAVLILFYLINIYNLHAVQRMLLHMSPYKYDDNESETELKCRISTRIHSAA